MASNIATTFLAGWLASLVIGLQTPLWAATPPDSRSDAPRINALLEQAWVIESGYGNDRLGDPGAAMELYCEAAQSGNPEAYYRIGLILATSVNPVAERSARYFSMASQLGHAAAAQRLTDADPFPPPPDCPSDLADAFPSARFDFAGYLERLPRAKKLVADLIRKHAPHYGIDTRLALAIAGAESNFNPRALSPKNAMGVMQLIPETAQRFGVRDPYNSEQNIHGGLAYLRWLHRYYGNDPIRVVAAYNAGEGAVDKYAGPPPYPETLDYVRRVMRYSGKAPAARAESQAAPRDKAEKQD